nr:F-box protein At5g07610-like [Ipomoea batatas]
MFYLQLPKGVVAFNMKSIIIERFYQIDDMAMLCWRFLRHDFGSGKAAVGYSMRGICLNINGQLEKVRNTVYNLNFAATIFF